MNKHEFHIALLFITLITAGVIGYQLANGDFGVPGESNIELDLHSLTKRTSSDPDIDILLPVFEIPIEIEETAGKSTKIDFYFPSELPPPASSAGSDIAGGQEEKHNISADNDENEDSQNFPKRHPD